MVAIHSVSKAGSPQASDMERLTDDGVQPAWASPVPQSDGVDPDFDLFLQHLGGGGMEMLLWNGG